MQEAQVLDQFETDEMEHEVTSGANARMFSPGDAVDWLKNRGSDLQDLLVDDASRLNLISLGGEGEGEFGISPNVKSITDNGGKISSSLEKNGYIRLTENSVRQLCNLLGVPKGFVRYKGMHAPEKRLISDFLGKFSGESGKKSPLIFRTSTIGGTRQVEGIIPQSADRTDENKMVRIAMTKVMERVGQGMRGVEFIEDPKRATRSFRLVFGNPCFDHDAPDGSAHLIKMRDRMYPMIDMRLSAVGVVTPQVSLGVWRVVCRNSAVDELCKAAQWTGGSDRSMNLFEKSMEAIASLAVPMGNLLGQRCDEIYSAPLNLYSTACIERMMNLGAITSAHGDAALNLFEHGYGHDMPNGDGQWGMFNALTDAAKVLNPIQSRRSAESRSMTLAMQRDGFNGVCENGLNINKSRAGMIELFDKSDEIRDVLARVAANN